MSNIDISNISAVKIASKTPNSNSTKHVNKQPVHPSACTTRTQACPEDSKEAFTLTDVSGLHLLLADILVDRQLLGC